MKNLLIIFGSILINTFFLVLPTFAQNTMRMESNRPSFSDFDLNGDGVLTEQEFLEARAKRIAERSQQGYPMRGLATAPTFREIDHNGDGQVTQQEFAAAQAHHRQQMWQ